LANTKLLLEIPGNHGGEYADYNLPGCETLIIIYQTTRHQISEDCNFKSYYYKAYHSVTVYSRENFVVFCPINVTAKTGSNETLELKQMYALCHVFFRESHFLEKNYKI
jgi:hypothetical protein